MSDNVNLTRANKAKKDEFYTQLADIEKELKHYRKHFAGKTVFCNCDDPFESNFFKYFVLNFNRLGLKKVIATCYAGSPITGTQLSIFDALGGDNAINKPYKAIVTKVHDADGDGDVDMMDIETMIKTGEIPVELLEGDGDFRSKECLALMDEADIVVTNPPFSLFREYVHTLMVHDKKFIIIGNKNAITYKEIFPLIKENKLWVGMKPMGGSLWFSTAEGFERKTDKIVDGVKLTEVPCCWFTNLDIKKRHEDLILVPRYSPDRYSHYDNYDAIEVSKVVNIPCDYAGVMGVPITFLDKYNPDQFEILGATESEGKGFSNGLWDAESGVAQPLVNGQRKYKRLFIRNKHPEQPKL